MAYRRFPLRRMTYLPPDVFAMFGLEDQVGDDSRNETTDEGREQIALLYVAGKVMLGESDFDLVLRFYREGMTFRQLAENMNCNPGRAHVRHNKSLALIRLAMERLAGMAEIDLEARKIILPIMEA